VSDADSPKVKRRELYLDAFRGVMALVMVQGHVFTRLLTPEALADPIYHFQLSFHGSTAPGFLFASGFVAGLPFRSLDLRTALRRGRRLLFVLGVGYFLHLPFFALWKIWNEASAAQLATLYSCDALQAIAVTQLFVMLLQALFGRRWVWAAGACCGAVIAVSPWVWDSGLAARVHPALGAYLDRSSGSAFPLFPYAAFVLGGNLAGAAIGRRPAPERKRRAVIGGLALVALAGVLELLLRHRIDFWAGPSPAYVVLRLGGLLLLLRLVHEAADRALPGMPALGLLGQETLQVYVLHLAFLYGGILGPGPLAPWAGSFGFTACFGTLFAMLPLLYAPAVAWHRWKRAHPHEAVVAVSFPVLWFLYEFLARPW
jgi:hypothetical protein